MRKALGAGSVMLLAAVLGSAVMCGEALAQPAPPPPPPPAPRGDQPAPPGRVDPGIPAAEVPPATAPAQAAPVDPAGAATTPPTSAGEATAPTSITPGAPAAAAPATRSPLDVPPPPPGEAEGATPPPPPPPLRAFANESSGSHVRGDEGPPLAGWHGRFYLRDKDDHFRLYPGGQLQVELQAWAGSGVDGSAASAGGAGLPPRFVFRRGRFELAGELLKRWSFAIQIDTGLSSGSGGADLAVGEAVAPNQARVSPANVFIDYDLCDCFHMTVGQVRAPVSLENRTSDNSLVLHERSIATRGLVAPLERETGILLWGDLFEKLLTYELMVAGGDGNNRPQADSRFDWMGRILVRPFQSIELLEDAHIAVDARHGDRDQYGVGYDAPSIVTGQGLSLWSPIYEDSQGRPIHIIPSGAQNQIGGDIRLPLGPFDVRGELHYVANDTREAVEGFELSATNAERLGQISGWAAYGAVTWWALGDEYVSGTPGVQRPATLNLKKKPELKRGLAVSAVASAIIADYDGNQRGGEDDAATPGSSGNPRTSLDVLQLAGNLSYWHTRHVRLGVEYSAYLTGGTEDGLPQVPGNLGDGADPADGMVSEISSRIQVVF